MPERAKGPKVTKYAPVISHLLIIILSSARAGGTGQQGGITGAYLVQ